MKKIFFSLLCVMIFTFSCGQIDQMSLDEKKSESQSENKNGNEAKKSTYINIVLKNINEASQKSRGQIKKTTSVIVYARISLTGPDGKKQIREWHLGDSSQLQFLNNGTGTYKIEVLERNDRGIENSFSDTIVLSKGIDVLIEISLGGNIYIDVNGAKFQKELYYTHSKNGQHYATSLNSDGTLKNWTWKGGHGLGNAGWQMADLFGDGKAVYYTHHTDGTHFATRLNADGTLKNWTWKGGHGVGNAGWKMADLFGAKKDVYYTHSKEGAHYVTRLNADGTVTNWTWTGGHGIGDAGWNMAKLFK